jgi:hypothetical protein
MFKFTSVPAYSFGKSRANPNQNPNPGPGAYDGVLLRSSIAGSKIGKAPRTREYRNDIPGPGSYGLQSNFDRKGGVISGKLKNRTNDDIPGPGQYDSSGAERRAKGFSFGKSSLGLNKSAHDVGPGAYDPYKNGRISETIF